MPTTKHPIKRFRELSQVFHVAYEDHYTLALTGSLHRLYRTGFVLRKLIEEKKILTEWWGKRKIYMCKRRAKNNNKIPLSLVPHGLMCTEILIRIYLSKYGNLLSNADFSGQVAIPDGGVRFPDKSQILFEYSTSDNFKRKKLMADKVTNYSNHDSKTIVLFVFDAPREKVEMFAKTIPSPVWFCDLDTFLTPAYHEQLQAPIYIWGGSGQTLPIIG